MHYFCAVLKIGDNTPKRKLQPAQRTPKCVGVNWMTQSISIKDFEALIPPVCVEEIENVYRWLLHWVCSK